MEEEAAALFTGAEHRGVTAAASLVIDSTPRPDQSWNVDQAAAGTVLRDLLQPTVDYLAAN